MVFLVRNEGAAFAITSFEDHAPPQIMQTNETQLGTEIELLSGIELHRQVISALHPNLRGKALEHELCLSEQFTGALTSQTDFDHSITTSYGYDQYGRLNSVQEGGAAPASSPTMMLYA